MIKKKKSKGTVIIDATLTLPIFILSMVLIINCILQCAYEAKLYKELCEDISLMSVFQSDAYSLKDYSVLSGVTSKFGVYINVYYRPFLGDLTDENSDYENVYIFKKSGKKYHYPGCSTMDYNANYTVVTKVEALSNGYDACKLCSPGGKDYFKK